MTKVIEVLSSGAGKLLGHLARVVRVDLRVLEVAAHQPHATPAEDIDGGNDQHSAQYGLGETPELSIVGELQGHWDVLGFAQRLDHKLKCVLVLADDTQLVALDADL